MGSRPSNGERDLRYRYDWSPHSDAPEHYIAAFADATQVNITLARGQEIEDINEIQDGNTVFCPHCAEWTTRGFEECHFCGDPIDADELEVAEPISHPHDDGRNVHRKVIEGDVTAEDLKSVRRLESELRSHGEKLFRQLDQLIEAPERLEADESGGMRPAADPFVWAARTLAGTVRSLRRRLQQSPAP